jgi:DNA/RNA endonuclease YhcR with UshA esterase domain
VDEASEGLLIRVRARVTGDVLDDQPWGWKLMLDDGSGALLVFVDAQAGIDVSAIRAGQWLQVTGYSGQYEEHREILPRTQSDLRPIGEP